ncbi:hypothetical protein [Streptomyces tritici]|uniref:hypothetical protein n=1 Tax=Streptomyces tritici TaxID=2054410 RepID=UPI003AF15EA6
MTAKAMPTGGRGVERRTDGRSRTCRRLPAYGMRQGGPAAHQGGVNDDGRAAEQAVCSSRQRIRSSFFREFTMADVAFVVTTAAVFALVAFIAKGVAKL